MAERRFGPVRGAGTVIREESGPGTITPGALGSTAYTGIMQKGPINKPFMVRNTTMYAFRAGGIIPDSLLPDAALDRLRLGRGAGQLWLHRITDGDEKSAFLNLTNRQTPRALAMKVDAGNPGRWGGKKQTIIDEYDTVTQTTLQLSTSTIPSELKDDELKGGLIRFNAIPGKSFEIVSNTADGLLTVASDVDLVDELGGSTDKLVSVQVENDGEAVAVKISEGSDNPATEFKLEVFFIEGGISTRQRTFDNLSPDPDAGNYFEKVINDNSDADFLVKVEDLQVGNTVTADIRPANLAGQSLTLTDTVLTAKITDEIPNSPTGAKATLQGQNPGGSVVRDTVTLTVTATGARASGTLTFSANPDPGDQITIDTKTISFVSSVSDPTSEVLIGADAEETLENLVAFINERKDVLDDDLYLLVFAEKASASEMDLFAATAGAAGDNISTTSSGGVNVPTFSSTTLTGGVDQTWDYASEEMPFLTGLTVTSGVDFSPPNQFAFGFKVIDTSFDSSIEWQVGEELTIEVRPLEPGALVGGDLVPNSSLFRQKFEIVENDSESITVKTGSAMTTNASAGDSFTAQYQQQLGGGNDGVANIGDIEFIQAYDPTASPLRNLRGKNLGLVKLASPGSTSTQIQKAGVAFAASQNWQYRYEIPSNIVSESAAEEYVNETLGKNLFAAVTFPTYAYVTNPTGQGTKLTSQVGAIHGVEARIARNFEGFHKAGAGTEASMSNIVALPVPLRDKELDQEILNPAGIGIIKASGGNFLVWGDRIPTSDPSFTFKHKREYLSHVENVFLENFDFIIFALNNPEQRQQLKSTFIQYFQPEFAKSAIVGESLQDAAEIKIDEENNPLSETQQGNLHAAIGLQIVDTVERFIITMSKLGITESTG